MKYANKDIGQLADSELLSANSNSTLRQALVDLAEKRQHPKFQKKMENQPPPGVNPAFTDLLNEVNTELDRRKIDHL